MRAALAFAFALIAACGWDAGAWRLGRPRGLALVAYCVAVTASASGGTAQLVPSQRTSG